MATSVDWLKLPTDLARRIRFLQIRDRLQTALERRPEPQVDCENCEVWAEFEFDCRPGCYLTYNWEEDKYEWLVDDNAYGESTFRQSDGKVYTIDHHTARFGYVNPLKSILQFMIIDEN